MNQQKKVPREIACDVGVELGERERLALKKKSISERNILVAVDYFNKYEFARFLQSSVRETDRYHMKRLVDAGALVETRENGNVIFQFTADFELDWFSIPYGDIRRDIRERIWNKRVVDVSAFERETYAQYWYFRFPARWRAEYIRDLDFNFIDAASLTWIGSIGQFRDDPTTILASYNLEFVDHPSFVCLYIDKEFDL